LFMLLVTMAFPWADFAAGVGVVALEVAELSGGVLMEALLVSGAALVDS